MPVRESDPGCKALITLETLNAESHIMSRKVHKDSEKAYSDDYALYDLV